MERHRRLLVSRTRSHGTLVAEVFVLVEAPDQPGCPVQRKLKLGVVCGFPGSLKQELIGQTGFSMCDSDQGVNKSTQMENLPCSPNSGLLGKRMSV